MLGMVIEPLKTEIRNLARHGLYVLRQNPRASLLGFAALARYVRTLLGLSDLSNLPLVPYMGYSIIFVDRFDHLLETFPGLNIDDF
jgi:hypothetical protein